MFVNTKDCIPKLNSIFLSDVDEQNIPDSSDTYTERQL